MRAQLSFGSVERVLALGLHSGLAVRVKHVHTQPVRNWKRFMANNSSGGPGLHFPVCVGAQVHQHRVGNFCFLNLSFQHCSERAWVSSSGSLYPSA